MKHDTGPSPQAAPAQVIAQRYRVGATLGAGGMAVVHQVLDLATGRQLALKRLRSDPGAKDRAKTTELFEREYLTLAQLAHPRIVEAYDYGVEDGDPYYTMELLDGGDLQGLAPVDYRRACAWGRDICSALALLHSRRLVYRDLSPRNVRCTSDGLAKLIDFGALAAMGPSRELVGTLPYIAPETLQQQPLDARTDLYSLGATLYYMVVKRHAYPARDIVQLRDLWRSRPRRPTELVPSTPEALERLILDLMNLDPSVRPASAAEVMQRLSAIAGLRVSEQLLVHQAYLATPSLVGCATQLATVRRLMLRAMQRRGVSLLISGAPGVGRSRFLDACVLEAKLAGLLVLRADSTDGHAGEYGVVRALATQLLKASPVLARANAEPYLPLLGHVLPELIERRPDVALEPIEDVAQRQRRLQPALRHWLLDVARQRPLMLAIDDTQRIDDASAGLIALLAQEVASLGMVIAASASRDEDASTQVQGALELLHSASTMLALAPLSLELTERLLGSVFGDAANLPLVTQYVHRVAGGRPRDVMRLAQHLVSEGTIRYLAGSWSLPDRLGAAELPSSMAEALKARIAKLSTRARLLALALACEPRLHFTFEECASLTADGRAQTRQTLDELIEAEVAIAAGDGYALAQHGWSASLVESVTVAQKVGTHLRLATLLEQRGTEDFRAARHLFAAGEQTRGLDRLLGYARHSRQLTDGNPKAFFELLAGLPADWLDTYEQGLLLCERQGRPRRDHDALLIRVAALMPHAVSNRDSYEFAERRIEWLRRDSGLDDYLALPDSMDPGARLQAALGAAAARYACAPEHERLLDVPGSIGQLALSCLPALGTIATTGDYHAWCRLPSLAPLASVAPAMGVLEQLRVGVGARISGRSEDAIAIYERVLARLGQPDGGGIAGSYLVATTLRVNLSIATLEAVIGRSICLERAKLIEQEPNYEPQAALIRHLYYLWQGDRREAARCKQQIEVLRCQTDAHHGFEGQHLLSELCAYALADDLTRVKRALDAVEPRALVHPTWQAVLHFGLGEYHRIRGDHVAALEQLELAVPKMAAAHHQIWAHAAGAHLRVLLELDRAEAVREIGAAYLRLSEERGLGYGRNYVRMPLSLALSQAGEHEQAVAMAQAVIEELIGLGATGLHLGAAYETRARIDLEMKDQRGFERHAALCAEQWRSGEKRLAGARYQRQSLESPALTSEPLDDVSVLSQFTSTLENCESPDERARCGLEYLGRQSGAIAGLLYAHVGGDLRLMSSFGDLVIDAALDAWARAYFRRELADDEHTSAFSSPPGPAGEGPGSDGASEPKPADGLRYVPVLLTHQEESGPAITGLALLVTRADAPFIYPSRIAAELSRCVAGAGDVTLAHP